MIDASFLGLTANQLGKIATDLKAENVELRELAEDLWRFTGTACKRYPRLFDPPAQGGQMVLLNALDAFEQRMRDLGIEVDDDAR
jgi:hypothetical protein